MNLKLKEIIDKNVWEGFLRECKEKSFLQSWNWGIFQKRMGCKIWRRGIYNGEELVGETLIVKTEAKRGSFLFLPHGPVLISNDRFQISKVFEVLLDELKRIARKEKVSFIRIAPLWENSEENKEIFEESGFRPAPIHLHPETTWELDIRKSEQELLKDMRKTTRYLIRQAQNDKDIGIIQSQSMEDLKIFNNIYQETARRHKFVPFSFNYLDNQFSVFKQDNQISVFLGKYKNEVVSSAVIVHWQNIGFYHHGASLQKFSKIPVSYLLQWEAIKEAKKRGCEFYNFWGIAPDIKNKDDAAKSRHPWAGLSLFKMGFSGSRKEYVKTQDLPLSKKYYLTYIIERIRKFRRGL